MKPRASHSTLKPASLPIKSKTACRAGGLPEREEGRTHLLIQLPIEEENRWCLWRPEHAGFDSKSIFEGALVEE
jgi:hypothetical protein